MHIFCTKGTRYPMTHSIPSYESTAPHRLLVLGSMDEFVNLVDTGRERGYTVVVADGYADGPAKPHGDASFEVDVRDIDAVAALAREQKVDGIIGSFSDVLFESVCRSAHAAGLYAYCPLEGLPYLRDKRAMGAMFAELGIPTAVKRAVRRSAIEEDCANLRWPCVVKPVNGYGSYGISVVESAAQVAERFDAAANVSNDADTVLVEEYDEAPEINMIGWVAAGRAYAVSLADREKCPIVPGGVPDVVRIVYPSRYAAEAAGPATAILQKVADYVGMEDGPLSMQFFWHPNDGTLSVCEVAGRVLGYEHELTEIGAGFSIEDALLDLVYDRPAMRERVAAHSIANFEGVSFVLNFHAEPEATGAVLADASVAQKLLERPEVLVPPSMLHYRLGETVGHGKGAKPYLARLFCHVDTREEADALTAELFGAFSLRDGEGLELACREWLPFMEGAR